MTHATICIPEQQLQRMHGKTMTNQNDNPYKAPTLERTGEFRHTDNAILSLGHQFAKICLVTGRTDHLVARRIGLASLPMTAKVVVYRVP